MANLKVFFSVVHPPWRYCFSGFGRPDGGELYRYAPPGC
ncbi:unnamed protein product [Brassica rapa subsp. narinosa]